MMEKAPHISVLLTEAVDSLNIQNNGVYVDGTFGAGGYTRKILDSNPTAHVIAIDQDETAIASGQKLVKQYAPRLTLLHGKFGDMDKLIDQPVDGVVLDIGVSSMQIDNPDRGFSFQKDGPLDMRMGQTGPTAADIVNTFSEKELADIIFKYGDEKMSRRIAKKIVSARCEKKFETTMELANAIHMVMPHKAGDIDSATRTFQALRIFVNDELGQLEQGLNAAVRILKDKGILSVVSFHSLEDRIVKNFINEKSGNTPNSSRYLPEIKKQPSVLKIINKKPITPTQEEIQNNPRARSSKLRIAMRVIS